MNIALKLQELLKSRGISRSKLAKDIGVHTSTVSNWIDGKDVKSENLAALCSYFGCSLDYLTDTTAELEKAPTPESESGRHVNVVTIAGRDGSYKEKRLTDEQIKALQTIIDQMPEAPDDL